MQAHDNERVKGYGQRLRLAREAVGRTQEELARDLGVNTGTVSRWERESGTPHMLQLAELARLLGASLDYLVLGRDESKPAPVPPAFLEFLQTELGRTAQQRGYVAELLRIRPDHEPTVDLYWALTSALVLADSRRKPAK